VQRFADGRVHLRPLLDLRREEIERHLRACSVRWRTDASNATPDFLRNRMRHQVIPAWRGAHSDRDAVAGAALARERLQEDDEALEEWLNQLAPLNRRGELELERLAGLPRAIWRRALHRWLQGRPGGPGLSRQGFDQLLAGIESGRPFRFSLGARQFAVVRGRRLRAEPC